MSTALAVVLVGHKAAGEGAIEADEGTMQFDLTLAAGRVVELLFVRCEEMYRQCLPSRCLRCVSLTFRLLALPLPLPLPFCFGCCSSVPSLSSTWMIPCRI